MAEEDRVDISEEVNPPIPAHSQPPPMHAPPPPTPAGILPEYSGAPPTRLPPPTSSGTSLPPVSLTSSASDDQARITALEGTVNQMATNMAELLALLRGPNRASSSSTPPPGQGPTVDPTAWVPPTQAPENRDAPASPTLHTSMAHPFTSPYPTPPAPTAVPLPPATFLSSEQALSAPPPISIPGKMLQYWEYEEFVFHSFQDSLSGSTLNWFMSLRAEDIPMWEDLSRKFIDQYWYCAEAPPTLLELSTKEMAQGQSWPTLRRSPTSSRPGRSLIWGSSSEGWKGPASRGEESSKKVPATLSSSGRRRGKEVSVKAVNTAHQASQQYSVNLTTTPTTAPTYFPPPLQHQPQSIYYSAPPPSQPRPPMSRAPPPAQQNPAAQGPQAGGTQNRPRRQYTPLPAPLSHIYRQLLAGNQIRQISPGTNFDPSAQDQSKRCKYHQGAPGHTLDNCWRLRDEIQRRINSNRLTFNVVRPPNVQDNPLSDHRPSLGPSINMISICASGRDEDKQGNPLPFVIDYTPEEPTVGFTGNGRATDAREKESPLTVYDP
ncbi:hypothetical protein CRG98_045671 [Punica granatum]|uniref:Retrotransposon gag domain-containing protein n=1 Tax=Punica granatum TaxID=22663 RepID=A0A2I0HQG2_PUNGR|nr:hypothetical protein CRG98_045671 [Punica granatum]